MVEIGKRGSSRRKGDEYQDLTALRLALETYVHRKPFKMFLDYEKSGNFDDIVLFEGSDVFAYQVKYAVNPLENYKKDDFLNPDSSVSIKKFATSWQRIKNLFPGYRLTVYLYSNKGLDNDVLALINSEGKFEQGVIEDRRRGNVKKLRLELAKASGLDTNLFKAFLTDFQFLLRQPDLPRQEQYIRTVLLDKELGLSDDSIFLDLKDIIKNNAISSREAITFQSIHSLLTREQSKLFIPQIFPVNKDQFIEQKSFSDQLDKLLPQVNGEYLIVTGPPGSGKSTSLTMYFDALRNRNSTYEVFRYYCFVGVNDNAQRMRVQAESLRANLLSEFHRRCPDVLKRRLDYSESSFLECLETLAKFFVDQGRRLVIFLDGLDHAERFGPEIRETVMSALPSEVPKGATIVVGTQELHKWPYFLKRARECPNSHISMPLFSEAETRDYLENKRAISGLTRADILKIYKKSEGLPLYLRYAAEILILSESLTEAINSLGPASGGDIRNYYGLLWDEFERVDMGEARHLCAVMACIRFSVQQDELYKIARRDRPAFEDAYKSIRHLLRDYDGRITIFHSSFREFVVDQLSDGWIREIISNICTFLKDYKYSPRWFSHVFKYCYEAEDYTYVLNEVNKEFVDQALLYCRPSAEIFDAIHWGIEAAFNRQDIVQLSRLGTLKFRTYDRLENNLNRALLADALLALGREQDVITFAYSPEADHWLVDSRTALAVMYKLAETEKLGLGQKLFGIFMNEFRDTHFVNAEEERFQVIGMARCLAIYMEDQEQALRCLAQFKLSPGILEQQDLYAPGYSPHLDAYIDTLVKFGFSNKWKQLKYVKGIFPSNLMSYLLIRALARYNLIDELHNVLSEYLKLEQPWGNVELAFYAAMAGLPTSEVATIAGIIKAPKAAPPDYISPSDSMFRHYLYTFIVVAYEGNEEAYENLSTMVGTAQTLWNAALRHLLVASHCIGQSFRGSNHNWYEEARKSISILVQAEQGQDERIFESMELIREVLQLSISLLTEQIQKWFPECLSEWIICLDSLRDSFLWNTHFGIGESLQDYAFELRLWETITRIPKVCTELAPILKNCAKTYEKSTLLKGNSRSDHFIWLSAIMAKCGMRNDAVKWLRYGIRSSLIYGYHKDVTLFYLIDVLDLVNQRQPELALERCARVLSMVDWMPHLTDNEETEWLPQKAFRSVLKVNQQAAFVLLTHFSKTIARWQMQDCLEEFILSIEEGDPEYLWCITELFANHFSEKGRHCNQIMKTRQHIVNLVHKSCSEKIHSEFETRFRRFILTEITPKHWPEDLKKELGISDNTNVNNENANSWAKPPSEFKLDGENITIEAVAEKCRAPFAEFLVTIDKLKKQNEYFYERDLVNTSLKHHIMTAKSSEELIPIKEYAESKGRWQDAIVIEQLAKRFEEFGDYANAISCLEMAYACQGSWSPWQNNRKYLVAIVERDRQTAMKCVLKQCYESTSGSGGGYETACIAAYGLDVLDESQMLEDVFNDFLTHCESMFAQLPKNNNYAWLKGYKELPYNLNQLILNFFVDELSTSEIDHAQRMIRAMAKLAIARPDMAIPVLSTRIALASGRILRRMLTVIYCLATHFPQLLVPHQQMLAKILDRENFFCRQIVLRILHCVDEVSPLEASVNGFFQLIDRNCSATIHYSSNILPSCSTPEFKSFLEQNTSIDFTNRVELMEKILQIRPGSLVAGIEERLIAQGWSIDGERKRIKDDWDGHVHPQGWPVVWITTEFQELVTETLWGILDEVTIKLKSSKEQIDWLWHIMQPADPEYVLRGLMPRPLDIEPLDVPDKEAWFSEMDSFISLEIKDTGIKNNDREWITIFEKRRMAQEEKYNVPYRQEISLQGFLIPQQVYGSADRIDELELAIERILPNSSMSVTIKQTQAELSDRGHRVLEKLDECIPLIAEHENPLSFLGYRSVCTLASFIIKEFDLSFEGLNLVRNGEIVAKYEAWQEGYQDECYTREKLSLGFRSRVRRGFLTEICRRHNKILCICVNERREYHKSIYERKPDDSRDSRRYKLYHL